MMHVEHVSAHYKTITGPVLAIEDVNFAIHDDEIFGIAGESGCGKSTLLKILYDVLRFPLELTEGRVVLEYQDRDGASRSLSSGELHKSWWNAISYVPQAAMSVLNPVYRIDEQFFETIRKAHGRIHKAQLRSQIAQYLRGLGLPETVLSAYPHQLSGGMRQRVVIAMATFLHPNMILADEPTTALDVVVQRNILMMLMALQKEMHNTLVIVSHDMGVHYQITDRMGIMYAGSMVELGRTNEIFESPLHPYTEMLIGALPKVGDRRPREGIPGAPPSLRNPPPGCRFADRCRKARPECTMSIPKLREIEPGRFAACHLL